MMRATAAGISHVPARFWQPYKRQGMGNTQHGGDAVGRWWVGCTVYPLRKSDGDKGPELDQRVAIAIPHLDQKGVASSIVAGDFSLARPLPADRAREGFIAAPCGLDECESFAPPGPAVLSTR